MSRQLVAYGPGRGGRAGVEVQLGHDMPDMILDRAIAEEEPVANDAIGVALDEQTQHLQLARAEAMGIGWYTCGIGIDPDRI
jgi:hypothetical protein